MRMRSVLVLRAAAAAGLFCLAGCSRPTAAGRHLTYAELLHRLADQDAIARLDAPRTELISTYDRTGGNEDHSFFSGRGPDGWNLIADLDGPGVVCRFWTTGVLITDRLRFYFDGESTPRLEGSLIDLLDENGPFHLPLSGRENLCFTCYVPLPYARRLVITAEPSPGHKHYYQLNYQTLKPGTTVDSFSLPLDGAARDALQRVVRVWTAQAFDESPTALTEASLRLAPGESGRWELPAGPAIAREIRLRRLDRPALGNPLNDVRLQVHWDQAGDRAQIDVPLGAFFGQPWYDIAYRSLYVGGDGEWLYQRLPMPYRERAVLTLANRGQETLALDLRASVEQRAALPAHLGFLHAAWAHSGPGPTGVPHTVLNTKGRGRLAGCLLGAAGGDASWWILESDESIRRDAEASPGWRGTGLEDYFNGGWYYARSLSRPMHGLTFQVPFRTLQYRFHGPDPVTFDSAVEMQFEHGPDNQTPGTLESLAFYYLAEPVACAAADIEAANPRIPANPLLARGVMLELRERERHGDYRGAACFLDAVLAAAIEIPDRECLTLRQLAYREEREGFDAVREDYRVFREAAPSARARAQVEDLLWFHEAANRALLMVYTRGNARVRVGPALFEIPGNEADVTVARVTLEPGRQVLAAEVAWQDPPQWFQCSLRTHHGYFHSDRNWRWHTQPDGNWRTPDYDDSAWSPILGVGVKGPPDLPFFDIRPHPHLHLHGEPYGLWVDVKAWPADRSARAVLRTVIDLPTPP